MRLLHVDVPATSDIQQAVPPQRSLPSSAGSELLIEAFYGIAVLDGGMTAWSFMQDVTCDLAQPVSLCMHVLLLRAPLQPSVCRS
jgi:hypothetical protein